ncbi:hypothetical protein ES708_01544 [subsurface metagenome]
MDYLFDKYQEDRCSICLRRSLCSQTEHSILLCAANTLFKGPENEDLLSEEEREKLKV